MKKYIQLSIVLLAFLSVNSAFAQGKRKYFDAYKQVGDSCLESRNYFGAHQAYAKALSYVENTEVNYYCAEACRNYQNYPDAELYYKKVITKDSANYRLASYWYAEMMKFQGKYDKAAQQFEAFFEANKRVNDYFTKKAQHEVTVCGELVQNVKEYKDLKVRKIEDKRINTMYAEYSPVQYSDSLFFFGGVRAINTGLADTSYIYSNYINRLSKATISNDTIFKFVGAIEDLNDPTHHAGNLTFAGDGTTAYFSKCMGYDCAIYKAKFDPESEKFSDITKLPNTINKPNTTNTTPHLAVTPTGEILFFSSNAKGGRGGLDIWYSRINENGSFERPINCGPNVNTLGDEVTPFYDARDSLLYFSSEWHSSLGGFDIFTSKANLKNDTWSNVVNVGKPMNSSYNDLYYQYSRDSLRAFWVSNRAESQRLISKAYSNDIYYHPLVRKSVARITDLVPIYLYFDNDHPDPRSRDTITDKDYETLYQDFMAKKDEYIHEFTRHSSSERYEYDLKNMETFFTDLQKEYERLFLFAQLMEVLLKDGQDIVVVFKGYASPLGNTLYNEIVSKKRISCIQNFFYEFHNGVLNQYLPNEPKSGKGSLKYGHQPIGVVKMEDTFYKESGEEVSAISDRKQRWMSVYSPAASYQRKIEIVAVTIEYEDELFQEIQQEIKTQKKEVKEEDIKEELEYKKFHNIENYSPESSLEKVSNPDENSEESEENYSEEEYIEEE